MILDTSYASYKFKELHKMNSKKIYKEDAYYDNLFVTVLSFGFKYGIPAMRIWSTCTLLPNPYYRENLLLKTGEKEIQDYVKAGGNR